MSEKASWKRRALWAFAVVDVIAIVLLWRLFGGDDSPQPPESDVKTRVRPSPAPVAPTTPRRSKKAHRANEPAPSPSQRNPAAEPPPDVDEAPELAPSPPPAQLVDRTRRGDALRKMYEAAAPCYRDQSGNARLRFTFVQRVRAGHAAVENLEVVEDGLGDAELSACIVGAITGLAWDTSAKDGIAEMTGTISTLGLRKRSSPPGQAPPRVKER